MSAALVRPTAAQSMWAREMERAARLLGDYVRDHPAGREHYFGCDAGPDCRAQRMVRGARLRVTAREYERSLR